MFRSIDAASPPSSAPPNVSAVLGYLGPVNRTPHVWTLQEWQRFGHLRQCGIWVPDLNANPRQQAVAAANAAISLGWKAHASNRRYIVRDMETAIDKAWCGAFDSMLYNLGFGPVDYGSAGVTRNNPPGDGYWIADWNDLPSGVSGALGHQYINDIPWLGTQVDYSVWDDAALVHFGFGSRKRVA
jgi:hypothetical protein